MFEDKKAMGYLSALMQLLMSIIGSGILGFFLEKEIKAKGFIMILSIIFGVIIGFILFSKKVSLIDKKK